MPREEQTSRALSKLLRHNAKSEGLKISDDGYINLAHVLNSRPIRPLAISLKEIHEIVDTNAKQRFGLVHISEYNSANTGSSRVVTEEERAEDDDAANWLIRANQGHSIKLASADAMHTPLTLEDPSSLPKVVVHGTTRRNWPLILSSGGLKPMGRTHIHFATGLPKGFESLPPADDEASTANTKEQEAKAEVISGMRNSSTVLIYVDLQKALESGLKFFVSQNGVVLCDGGEAGVVPVSVFKAAEERGVGTLVKDGEVTGTLSRK
jgi:2'-phosphotransferase